MNSKTKIFFWPVLIIVYFLTRLVNLKIIPIFTDEAIYTYWAQVALHDPANRFISLEDGKQPLFIWLAAILQKFIADPLIASRLVSVISGFGSMVGIFLLAKEIFANQKPQHQERIAQVACVLYVILPFTLLYDRMALFDSLLTMFGIWSTLFLIRLARIPRLENSILSGVAIGLATITKSSGSFFLYLMPVSLLFFDVKVARIRLRFLKWAGYALITFVIAQIIYNSLRLSPLFYIIGRKNLEFIRLTREVLADPFAHAISNATTLANWLADYISWPLFSLFVLVIIYGVVKKQLPVIFLAIYALSPFAAEVLFNKVLYPRFTLFYFPYVIILISFAINTLLEGYQKYQKVILTLLAVSLIFPLLSSFRLLTNPTRAKIAAGDTGQYLNDWPAGYGVSEIVEILKKESVDNQIYVGTEGTFGLLPYALQIYFFDNSNVHIIGFWPVDDNNLPQQIIDISKNNKTYFVFNENQQDITNSRLKLVAKFQKGKGISFMRFYEVIASETD